MTNILEIKDSTGNYIPLPTPSMDGYECVVNELNKASRNAFGNLYKYRINVKRSINVTWNYLKHDDFVKIMDLTSGSDFMVKYWDMQTRTVKEGKFYRGNDMKVTGKPPFKNDRFDYYTITLSFEEF